MYTAVVTLVFIVRIQKGDCMTQSDPIYGLIALSFVFGMGLTVLIGAIWLYATEWLMEKFNVSDPLDKYYKNLF